jgi:dUTP pyrophosphatase
VVVRIRRNADSGDVPMPTRMTEHSAGYDLAAAVAAPVNLNPGDIQLIPCGFAMAIPPHYEAQIRPRSGLSSRQGITLINGIGTIDSDYRGQVQVPLVNLGKAMFTITRGMRIAQMLILPVPRSELVEVDQLDDTPRGSGGFGHTGE